MTTWTKINKASGTTWTKVAKAQDATLITGGDPIGLLLALTYSTTSGGEWIKINKASGTNWTKVPKAV